MGRRKEGHSRPGRAGVAAILPHRNAGPTPGAFASTATGYRPEFGTGNRAGPATAWGLRARFATGAVPAQWLNWNALELIRAHTRSWAPGWRRSTGGGNSAASCRSRA